MSSVGAAAWVTRPDLPFHQMNSSTFETSRGPVVDPSVVSRLVLRRCLDCILEKRPAVTAQIVYGE